MGNYCCVYVCKKTKVVLSYPLATPHMLVSRNTCDMNMIEKYAYTHTFAFYHTSDQSSRNCHNGDMQEHYWV